MILSVTLGLLLVAILLALIFCGPCVYSAYRRQQQEEEDQISGLLTQLRKAGFDPEINTAHIDCPICMMSFTPDDDVTPLPCNENHYFHTECIEQWLRTKPECPLCKNPVTMDQLVE